MGFFSWRTQDTDVSIPNIHSNTDTIKVTMTDNKGNSWTESGYDGYGIFGGKDFYELLAEMNGKTTRDEGITLFFNDDKAICPNLTEDKNWKWRNEKPKDCESQGFFYEYWEI